MTMTDPVAAGDATIELGIKVTRADGSIECRVPYSAVYRLGVEGAMADLGYPEGAPVQVMMAESTQMSCGCGLVWLHPKSEPLICPRCQATLTEV